MQTSTSDPHADAGGGAPLEHGGKLWKPRPAATATAEDFIAARELVTKLHECEF